MTQILRPKTAMLYRCIHLNDIRLVHSGLKRVLAADWQKHFEDRSVVCEDCMKEPHPEWVHLRQCLICGHVGCCNSSPKKHATAHFISSHHAVIKSIEPNEDWGWCYVDEIELLLPASLVQEPPQAKAAQG
jgi:hypothetical protein